MTNNINIIDSTNIASGTWDAYINSSDVASGKDVTITPKTTTPTGIISLGIYDVNGVNLILEPVNNNGVSAGDSTPVIIHIDTTELDDLVDGTQYKLKVFFKQYGQDRVVVGEKIFTVSYNYGSLESCAAKDCLGSCNGSAQKTGKVCYKVVTV